MGLEFIVYGVQDDPLVCFFSNLYFSRTNMILNISLEHLNGSWILTDTTLIFIIQFVFNFTIYSMGDKLMGVCVYGCVKDVFVESMGDRLVGMCVCGCVKDVCVCCV